MRAALERSVERTIGSARRVAVMAGGGLDSAVLLALTIQWARRSGATAFAVALDFAGPGDDRPYLRALEAKLGCEVLRVTPEQAARRLSLFDGIDRAPFPQATGAVEVELMARARAEGAECVLSGAGGDELFDGDPRSLAQLAREGHLREALRRARELRAFAESPRVPAFSWVVRPLLARLMPRRVRLFRARRAPLRVPAWSGPVVKACLRARRERFLDELSRLPTGAFVDEAFTAHYRMLLSSLRHLTETAAGVERRDPYRDRDLIVFARSLPASWLLEPGGIRRGLFREAVRDLLPDALRMRRDKAWFEPACIRLVEPGGGLARFRDLAGATRLEALGLVEPTAFRAAFEAFVASPDDALAWATVFPALAMEAYLRAEERIAT
jgi:asparagine synthase (glutamine-hydrolysing)